MRRYIASVCLPACVVSASLAQSERFTIAMLPDTQFYSERSEWTYHFEAQTRWCAQDSGAWNLAFVTHVGDLVQNGSQTGEWGRADGAMDLLDGALPYSAVIGNHDWATTGNKDTSVTNYLNYFGPSRYAGYSWYTESDARGINHAQLFDGGGRLFLHIGLEWRPGWASDAIDWAQSVIDSYPGVPTIISTHEHLTDAAGGHRSASGNNVFNRLVRCNDQVFMVLGGHHTSGAAFGEFTQISFNDAGRPVIEMLADFQRRAEGGDGWLRLIEFLPDEDRIEMHTFSPSREDRGLSAWENDADSRFGIDIDFDERFRPVVDPVPTETYEVVQGVGGYGRAVDTTLREAQPNTPFGDDDRLWTDADDVGGLAAQALVRFEELVGPGGIPVDVGVLGAVLEFDVDNGGSGFGLHRTRIGWNANNTWNSLFGGISANGVEAWTRWDERVSAVNVGTLSIDVTGAVRAQLAGAPETGWALLPLGGDGVGLASSEAQVALRPRLRITTTRDPIRTLTMREGHNGYAGTRDTDVRAINADSSFGELPTALVDAQFNFLKAHALLRFDGVFGPGGLDPARGARVVSAVLRLNVISGGSGFTMHRVRVPWTEADTWSSLGGGIRADGVEAELFPIARVGADNGLQNVPTSVYSIDVTADVRRWQDGVANHGWALLPWPSGTDGLEFATREWSAESFRPELIVRYLGPCPADINGDGAVNTQDVLAYLNEWSSGGDADFNADGLVDTRDVLVFLNLWADGC